MLAPKNSIRDADRLALLTVFDLRSPDARSLLRGMGRAFGRRAAVEELGHGRVALVIQPGGATDRKGAG